MESMEIVKANTGLIRSVDDLSRIGKMMAVSGYFQDAKDAAQAAVKVQAGMEMGFGPFASMTGIYIIQGRPSIGANLMASAVKNNPKYDYRVKDMSAEVCRIEFFEVINGKRESIGVSEFTIAEARKANVKNLDKFPRNMLFARSMSNGIRWFCPDVFNGNVTYTPEELGADVDAEGYVTDLPKQAEPQPEPEPIIEGVVTPVKAESAPETAPEKPAKKAFDEDEFLRNFQRPASVQAMNIRNAETFQASDERFYKDMSVRELYGHWCGLSKRIKKETPEEAELTAMSISAICAILESRKIKEPNGGRPDPFVPGAM